jgi:hypothetical protein
MTSRDQRIYEEAIALWGELFAEPPPPVIDGAELLEMITRSLGDPNYNRLRSPFLRPSTITMPKRMTDHSADAA